MGHSTRAANVPQTFARTFGGGWVKVEPIVSATFEQPRTPQNYVRQRWRRTIGSTRNCLQTLANVRNSSRKRNAPQVGARFMMVSIVTSVNVPSIILDYDS